METESPRNCSCYSSCCHVKWKSSQQTFQTANGSLSPFSCNNYDLSSKPFTKPAPHRNTSLLFLSVVIY